ncbi:MAG: ABC transporter permease [Candidatus Fimimonas sp.]
MKTFFLLTARNIKLFFKDKGMFFISLITPVILLVLYATFLGNVYRSSFTDNLPEALSVSEKLINGTVAGQLLSSLLAVTPITVSFCSNMRMVQDKMNGARKDMQITPVKKPLLAFSYFLGTLATTLIVCYVATAAGLIYVAATGWFLSFADVMLVLLDVFLLSLFGTALSSLVNMFLSTQGQSSAVGTIVSAGYGFVCGAYMPISQFSESLQNVLMFLPGTYGTSLIRNHALCGVYQEMLNLNFPAEVVEGIKDSIDCNVYFFQNKVEIWVMYLVLLAAIFLLVFVYTLVSLLRKK